MNALCSICLELFHNTLRDNAFSPKCGHVFHHSCILDWHEKSPTCPDCRESFTKNEIYKLNFHCDDASDANMVTETKFKELQNELTKKNEEIAELQLELAKKNSEISELEENCRTVLENVESLSSENDRLKKDLESLAKKKSESDIVNIFDANESPESASSAVEENHASAALTV